MEIPRRRNSPITSMPTLSLQQHASHHKTYISPEHKLLATTEEKNNNNGNTIIVNVNGKIKTQLKILTTGKKITYKEGQYIF
jgi:hypothetical protein